MISRFAVVFVCSQAWAAPPLVRDQAAGHAMVTEEAGNNGCAATRSPFINDCDYDAAGALLQHLLGPLAPPAANPGGRLESFDIRAVKSMLERLSEPRK